MSFPRPSHLHSQPEAIVIRAFHAPALELGYAILDSMSAVEKIVLACFERSIPTWCLEAETENLVSAKDRLSAALIAAREELRTICNDWDMEQQVSDEQVSFPEKIFDLCSFMISLLQVSTLAVLHCDEILFSILNLTRWHMICNMH
jgi:hypothetical protein